MMQVLVDGEVWLGKPGMRSLTYDPAQVSMLSADDDTLVDPRSVPGCVAVWSDGDGWCWRLVDVDVTLVRGRITTQHRTFRLHTSPVWWQSDEDLTRKLSLRL